ncbi:hypothetical protein M2651_06465 [Clostridium sp. SYSU_GA19001]|uniref:hypothetical protein n=1 Tax=Clostridium caldaquaticum TaxID=2940653 RepID=UPI0020775341|nr:hypothetical protein [Clostridium caldaquaticum]MCM8710669.1 hypothetical protein [Clostridium caldaquaticum]
MFKSKEWRFIENEEKDTIEINIDIKNIEDILKNNESATSIEECLNKEIEEYLFKSIKCYPLSQKIKLLIIKENQKPCNKKLVTEIIHSHFCYKQKETEIYLKQQFRQWVINFVIGILFLILCLILGEIFDKFAYIRIIKIAKESLVIIGWVALWEPVTFILFGWRVIHKDKLYYRKLCNIPIEIVEKRFITPIKIGK